MSTALEPGTVFAGRYEVVQFLGGGAMGAVYEVVHLETARRHALKVMHPQLVEDGDFRKRFRLEARISAQIESEFVVAVLDAGVDAVTEMPFLVMELLRGEDLGRRLRRLRRFSPEEALTYLHQTALGLDKMHQASIIHRDLKPGNLFLTRRENGTPQVKILDFGVAKIVADAAPGGGGTMALGTPPYMAPEQLKSDPLTTAVDLYALGMVAYSFLVGSSYWSKETKQQTVPFLRAVLGGPTQPASERAAERDVTLPEGFDAWFAKATAVEPDDRFSSATESVLALAEVLNVEPEDSGIVLSDWEEAGRSRSPAPSSVTRSLAGAGSRREAATSARTSSSRAPGLDVEKTSGRLSGSASERGELPPSGSPGRTLDRASSLGSKTATSLGTALTRRVPRFPARHSRLFLLCAALGALAVLGLAAFFFRSTPPVDQAAQLSSVDPSIAADRGPGAPLADSAPATPLASVPNRSPPQTEPVVQLAPPVIPAANKPKGGPRPPRRNDAPAPPPNAATDVSDCPECSRR